MTALMYHDIVADGGDDASGFPGVDAALYKISAARFDAHLAALDAFGGRQLDLTFDDGGASAVLAADALERHGRRGWFFITADYIGTPGFVDTTALRDLHRRGHVVGSHSCSHPLRMAHCGDAQLQEEWTRSRSILSDVLGETVFAASVPGGDFSSRVATAARQAGFSILYTSEPTRRIRTIDGLSIRGRYAIQRWTSPRTAAALAAGAPLTCAAQSIVWNAKKLTKRIGGERYLRIRRLLLRHGDDVRWGDAGAN
jgi:peptidoglycan/xylan/chitin deacetylase (PgdA/CDA1 family)